MSFDKWLSEGRISKNAYERLTGQERTTPVFSDVRELKISVAISTYNRSSYLLRLLNSIKAQYYSNTEIVIVDDSSSDNTVETVEKYIQNNKELSVLFETNKTNLGVGESKKRAYQKCSGDIIIFADDDDYYIDSLYFSELNMLYQDNQELVMTIASTIKYHEKENYYEIQTLNTPQKMTTKEYFNGFMSIYTKPCSMFTMSLRASKIKSIPYEELKCFNDTSLYLFALLCYGYVFTIKRAVGVYYIGNKRMTGNTRSSYIVSNLESKEDIYLRAMSKQWIDNPAEWSYNNFAVTAHEYLSKNKRITYEDREVWKWMKGHLKTRQYFEFVLKVLSNRARQCFQLSLMWIYP